VRIEDFVWEEQTYKNNLVKTVVTGEAIKSYPRIKQQRFSAQKELKSN
jgi:hypothetical protein